MTIEEKQVIAATARKLIRLLEQCDDCDFVDLVLNCVMSADDYGIDVSRL